MRDTQIGIRLKQGEKEMFEQYADSIGISVSALVRSAVLTKVKGAPESPNTKSPRSLVGDQNDNRDGQ